MRILSSKFYGWLLVCRRSNYILPEKMRIVSSKFYGWLLVCRRSSYILLLKMLTLYLVESDLQYEIGHQAEHAFRTGPGLFLLMLMTTSLPLYALTWRKTRRKESLKKVRKKSVTFLDPRQVSHLFERLCLLMFNLVSWILVFWSSTCIWLL